MTDIVLTMDGTLLNWLKNVGDAVKAGEIVAEFEADKATVEVQAPTDGVIAALNAAVGDELKEGAVIARLGGAGEAPAPAATPAPAKAEAPAPTPAPAAATPAAAPSNGAVATTPEGRIKISPVARNMALERGIDIRTIRGTGPGGRIIKSDIENYVPSAAPAAQPAQQISSDIIPIVRLRPMPAASDDVEFIDVSRMRKAVANGTTESAQQIPHFYVTSEMDLGPLMELRKDLNAASEKDGIKITVNDLIVKAVAVALRAFPNLNTHYYGDKLVRYKNINVGIAVAPPNGGVIYVVAKNADKVSLGELARTNKEMIDRARELKLKPEDTRGATFSTSNLGPYEVDQFAAIINPPEAGVLAIGSARQVPVVKPDGTLGVGTRIKMTVSIDHRVSDGAEGGQFMFHLKQIIENPLRLLV